MARRGSRCWESGGTVSELKSPEQNLIIFLPSVPFTSDTAATQMSTYYTKFTFYFPFDICSHFRIHYLGIKEIPTSCNLESTTTMDVQIMLTACNKRCKLAMLPSPIPFQLGLQSYRCFPRNKLN